MALDRVPDKVPGMVLDRVPGMAPDKVPGMAPCMVPDKLLDMAPGIQEEVDNCCKLSWVVVVQYLYL